MGCDAGWGCAEDGMDAVESVHGIASLTRRSLVTAGAFIVIKVRAACALKDVAAHGRHIANLSGCTCQQGSCKHGVSGADRRMRRDGTVANARANPQTAISGLLYRGRK